MKKSLLALAALAATSGAFAQSSLQIDGILDAGYQSIDYKGNKVSGFAGNGSSTSQLNFRGTEDLGGGLSARFRVETDWNVASNNANTGWGGTASKISSTTDSTAGTSGSFGNGELRVGVAGNFGAVDIGAVNFNSLSTHLTGQPFGTAIGSSFRATHAGLVRSDNSLKYTSPSFAGFNVTLYKANKQDKATTTNFSTSFGAYDFNGTDEIGVNYAGGPVAASFSNLKSKLAAGGDVSYSTLGANYTFGAAKAFLMYQKTSNSANTTDNKMMSVSATYTMGATVLMAQIGNFENKASKKDKLTSVGADYLLSKRSAVYFRYEAVDDKAGAIAAASTIDGTGTKRTRTALGVRHSF